MSPFVTNLSEHDGFPTSRTKASGAIPEQGLRDKLAGEWENRAREYRAQTEGLLQNRAGNAERESLLWRARAYETCAEELRAALERPRPALPSLDEQMTAKIAALEAKNDARDKSNEKGPALPAPEPPECTCPKVPTDTQGRGGFGWSSECPAHRVLYGAALPAEPDRYDFPCGCRVWREEDHSLSTRTCEAHHAQWLKALPTMGASGANGVPAEHAPSDDRPDHDEMAEIPFEERYAVTNFPYTKPSNPNSAAPQPTYYVGHPNGTYTVADPQPDTRAGHPEGESP